MARRPGRPSLHELAARPAPEPVQLDPTTRRPRCQHCGHARLVVAGAARKSDGARPYRCAHCGMRYALTPAGVQRIGP